MSPKCRKSFLEIHPPPPIKKCRIGFKLALISQVATHLALFSKAKSVALALISKAKSVALALISKAKSVALALNC